jgi:hypothetical protein
MDTQMKRNFGLAECDEYFKELRGKTRCKGWTREEVYAAPIGAFKEYEQRFLRKNIETRGEASARRALNDLYFGSVSNFRPAEAVSLYKHVGATSVLDPCAGWGGRCFAAMHLGIDYTGFDTNINLSRAYAQMIDRYEKDNTTTKVYFEDSSKANFSKVNYDCVFTSPPYWDRELYENMPEYKTKDDFNNGFLKPILTALDLSAKFSVGPINFYAGCTMNSLVKLQDIDKYSGQYGIKTEEALGWFSNAFVDQRYTQDDAINLAKQYGKNWKSILTAIKDGTIMDPPMILNYDKTRYYLVGGNTRLMFYKALGVTPKVLMATIDLPNERAFYLTEGKLNESQTATIGEFIKYSIKNLGLQNLPSSLTLSYDNDQAKERRSFGYFDPNSKKIWVYVKNRNMADILRTLAHELVHRKQEEDGRLDINSGKTGSPIEDEANALAGVLLRNFGKINNGIYENKK